MNGWKTGDSVTENKCHTTLPQWVVSMYIKRVKAVLYYE